LNRIWIPNLIVALLAPVVIYLLYVEKPVYYVMFITEDYWAEYGSFIFWAAAFVFLAVAYRRQGRGALRPVPLLLLAGTLLIALDEISWGQRILGFGTPTPILQHNQQGETNIHNLVYVNIHPEVGMAGLIWCVAPYMLQRLLPRAAGWLDWLGVPKVSPTVWPLFLAAAYYLVAHPVLKSDEVGELLLAVAVAGQAFHMAWQRASAWAWSACLTLLAGATALLVFNYDTPYYLGKRLHQFAGERYPAVGMHRQALEIFAWIHAHPSFKSRETWLDEARVLHSLGREPESRAALERSLVDLRKAQRAQPKDPVWRRRQGEALALMGRRSEADAAFDRAIRIDKAHLKAADSDDKRARVHISLARTHAARGNRPGVREHLEAAESLASQARSKKVIRLMRDSLTERE
jgi:hypothetical protein